MDVMHACRCCLLCPPDKDLTTPHTHLGKTEIYADMIEECFDIHLQLAVGGSGSSGICSACVGRLRDASDFKLQVQRSQAELQARTQGASHVKEEDSAVKYENSEMLDTDDTDETCGPVPGEEPAVKSEALDEDTPDEILQEELPVKPEPADGGEAGDEMSREYQLQWGTQTVALGSIAHRRCPVQCPPAPGSSSQWLVPRCSSASAATRLLTAEPSHVPANTVANVLETNLS
ncbi:uncharacterized protein LOC125225747 isoform X3 [Leguminivora glycinivorella]|uniref:uncharacterized protein LOC125225747 isoform X3 n=1 Tax=Leguminivora glycinivorella TaxID=1035111 RepID=UPI00200C3C0D|nr:uncharacterized protein LOC125225747 isoform X3 [Leguminivora glycinivorella]